MVMSVKLYDTTETESLSSRCQETATGPRDDSKNVGFKE
jgi:hypothetical protein